MSSPRPLFREIMDFKDFVFFLKKKLRHLLFSTLVEPESENVCLSVRGQLFSVTALTICLIFCMKLADDKSRKITEPDF